MLRQLEIVGFKSHKHTVIKFSKGLNFIIGPSQSGKSAMLGAFNLLVNNRPLGGRYIKDRKGGVVSVTATFDDCKIGIVKHITDSGRVKSASYVLNGQEVASAIGSKIPDQVIRALRVSDVNCEFQDEKSFLITSSGGEFSRTVSRFVGMDIVEGSLSELRSRISASTVKISSIQSDLKSDKTELNRYRALPILDSKFEELKQLEDACNTIDSDILAIRNFMSGYTEIKSKLSFLDRNRQRVKQLIDLEKECCDLREGIIFLEGLVKGLTESRPSLLNMMRNLENQIVSEARKLRRCPYCFSTIGRSGIERIRRGLGNGIRRRKK